MLSFLNKKVHSVFILKNLMLNGYGNQNNKKSIFTVGLISKTTTSFALRHTFLYISLPLLLQENNVKLPTYTFLSLKTMKNSNRQMRQLYAYVANESIRGMCSPLNSHVLTKKKMLLVVMFTFFLHYCSFSPC